MKKIIIILLSILIIVTLVICIGLYFIGNIVVDKLFDSDFATSAELIDSDIPITSEQLQKVKKNISEVDKIKVAAIIIKNLSTDEINEMRDMASDGITSDEKVKAKDMIYNNFSENEINELKDMYTKYVNMD